MSSNLTKKNVIQLIIWSRDRACQCETLLNSIQQFAPDLFNIDLIYSYSDKKYLDGYRRLFIDYHEKITFNHKEDGKGKELLLRIIEQSKDNIICFTTDDTILYNKVKYSPQEFMTDCDVFSLRLGKNTIVQNHITGETQPILTNYDVEYYGNMCGDLDIEPDVVVYSWNFSQYNPLHNYGYPFGLDMHCYKKSMIVPILETIKFDKPNELETPLFYKKHLINPKIKCFEQSCAVNIPITNLSTITQHAGVSLEELNSKFLEGKKLRYKLDEVKIVGCHQLLEYELV